MKFWPSALSWLGALEAIALIAILSGGLLAAHFFLQRDSQQKAFQLLLNNPTPSAIESAVKAASDDRIFTLDTLRRSGVDLGQISVQMRTDTFHCRG